jgi:hypothetical protein
VTASGLQLKGTAGRNSRHRLVIWLLAPLMMWAVACFNAPPPGNQSVGFKSFLGIDFGASLRDTRKHYPRGLNESSPLGYPAYHVTDLNSDGIKYTDVIYEFDGTYGMQVVFSRFVPSAADAVLERLRRILGEPTQHTLTSDQKMAEALWLTPGGEEVRFERARHLLIVIGPNGKKLRKDVELRLENSSSVF